MSTHAIVLAAGKGTRMKSDTAKVLHASCGRSLLDWTLAAVTGADVDEVTVVVGHQAEAVRAILDDSIRTVLQEPQNGTGHAVQVAIEALDLVEGDRILVGYGDMPLIPASVYAEALGQSATASIVTTSPGPAGFGRIVRDDVGAVRAIVEERDCSPAQRDLEERNAGIYAFDALALRAALGRISNDNSQGELYLTDVIGILVEDGESIATVAAAPDEVIGVNTHADLAAVSDVLRARINLGHLMAGVAMPDANRVYIDADVMVEAGAVIFPDTHLQGVTTVEKDALVGPGVFAIDSVIGSEARVWYSVLRSAQVGAAAEVGPYASLRPGSVLGRQSKVGTFVETKNTTLGEGSKLPHLSYFGDATVGANSNIGAGSITCNYDGFHKHQTVIGDDVFVGSDTMFVAPVTIGDGAITGAGSVITSDVEEGALGIGRSPQKDVPGYAERRLARQRARDAEEGN